MSYIIYFDESIKEGKYFGNFYGGALVSEKHYDNIVTMLDALKTHLNLNAEIKWSKTTEAYLEKYKAVMDLFFMYLRNGKIKIRIMFKPNKLIANGLTREQKENEFFLLYYQFCKHAFGLQYCNPRNNELYVKMFFDKLPDTIEKNKRFKDFIYDLQFRQPFSDNNIKVKRDDIAEVTSHNHVILQCMDIVLGAMQFRLNNLHLEKPPGQFRRGKKTIAKEKLYKHIHSLINQIHPNFNIGISTGLKGKLENNWHHPYRHWSFTPSECEIDDTKTKRYNKK